MSATDSKFKNAREKISNYIFLPEEISPYEHQYLERINFRFLMFMISQVPVFMLVALIHDTGVMDALFLCLVALFGPLVGGFIIKNPRHISVLYGFTAMCMGGILVHLGQGPMQIEMHFYFFIMLAILAVYANPVVILVATVAVALHHLLLYFLLPESIFNYEAPVWVVLVHALFLVLESVAVVFMARNFFDNVIGLEKIVQKRTQQLDQRNQDMRLVLDNVSQGLMTISLDGEISSEHSAILSKWFEGIVEGANVIDVVREHDAEVAMWVGLSLEAIKDDFMPLELSLSQMPNSLKLGDNTLHMEYAPIFYDDKLEKLLVTFTDITARLRQQALEQEQREFVSLISKSYEDRAAFLGFIEEGREIIKELASSDITKPSAVLKREIHTLKGNSGFFGLQSIASLCHSLENAIQDGIASQMRKTHGQLLDGWQRIEDRMSLFLENQERSIAVEKSALEKLMADILKGKARKAILQRVQSWRYGSVEQRLQNFAKQSSELAKKLDKPVPTVQIKCNEIFYDPSLWNGFWSSFVHVVRNAVDHGIESAEERVDAGKAQEGRIVLSAQIKKDEFIIEVEDDGGGIKWDKLRAKAEKLGLEDVETNPVKILFMDGVSSRDSVSDTSGRGVGMAAVYSECTNLGGSINVFSTPNQGTKFSFRFPKENLIKQSEHIDEGLIESSEIWTDEQDLFFA